MKEKSKIIINKHFKYKRKIHKLLQEQIEEFYKLQSEYEIKSK